MYEQIPAYADSREKRSQAQYEWAQELMEQKEYEQAREKFLSLGAYQNAAAQAQECLYQPAAEALSSGHPLEAIEYFLRLKEYRDDIAGELKEYKDEIFYEIDKLAHFFHINDDE